MSALFRSVLLAADLVASQAAQDAALAAGNGAGRVGADLALPYAPNSTGYALQQRIPCASSIAELRGYSKLATSKVMVTGYFASGDGGGGLYVYDSTDTATADNAGTVIVAADNGRWKLQYQRDLSPRQFGAAASGIVDDTAALQACFTYAGVRNLVVDCEGLNYRVSGPLKFAGGLGGGIVGLRLAPTGSGYRVLTVTGLVTSFDVLVIGTGNAVDGILFGGGLPDGILQRAVIKRAEVQNLAGNGVSINTGWDCVFHTISVERCGTAGKYAFEVTSTGETTNMTHIVHLQVERSQDKAIYIDPNSLCILIDVIHSETNTASAGNLTWLLGGNRCTYNNVRLTAVNPEVASARITGANCTIVNLLTEGAISVNWQGYSSSPMTLVTPEIGGTLAIDPGQSGTLTVVGGRIAILGGAALAYRFFGTEIAGVNLGYANNDPTLCRFNNCKLGSVSGNASTVSAATFTDCTIAEHNGGLMQGTTVLENTTVAGSTALTVGFRTIVMKGSRLNGDIIMSGSGLLVASDTVFNGAMSISGGVPQLSILGAGCSCTGAISGINAAPDASVGNVGSRHFNIKPAVGSPKSWVKDSGGTWRSEGNV